MTNFFEINKTDEFFATVEVVNGVLYQLDILSTGCVENELIDEYQYEAEEIAKMLMCGFAMPFAVKTVFDAYFWDGCLTEDLVEKILSSL